MCRIQGWKLHSQRHPWGLLLLPTGLATVATTFTRLLCYPMRWQKASGESGADDPLFGQRLKLQFSGFYGNGPIVNLSQLGKLHEVQMGAR